MCEGLLPQDCGASDRAAVWARDILWVCTHSHTRVTNMRTSAGAYSDVPEGVGSFRFDVSDVADRVDVAVCMFAGAQPLPRSLATPLVVFVAEWSQTTHTATLGLKKRGPLQLP